MDTVEYDLFDYDLGFGEQQLIPNSQVITSSSQTPRDFPKQTPLNSTADETSNRADGADYRILDGADWGGWGGLGGGRTGQRGAYGAD